MLCGAVIRRGHEREEIQMNVIHFSCKKLFWVAAAMLLALAGTFAVLAGAGTMAGQAAAIKVGLVADSPGSDGRRLQ